MTWEALLWKDVVLMKQYLKDLNIWGVHQAQLPSSALVLSLLTFLFSFLKKKSCVSLGVRILVNPCGACGTGDMLNSLFRYLI